ncbi:MAG: aminopeptidase P family protein [Chloroflexi bacterium]|nr:aminopeptidase P family protein [Chloroflexota bacterium]
MTEAAHRAGSVLFPGHAGRQNVPRLQEALRQHGLDAVVASSVENVYYTCGVIFFIQRIVPERMTCIVTPASGDQTLVTVHVEDRLAEANAWVRDQRTYREFEVPAMTLLAEVLRERGLGQAKIGYEARHLAAAYVDDLRRLLPGATLVPGDEVFEEVRRIKLPHEIDILRYAARSSVKAVQSAFALSRAGDTETQVRDRMRATLADLGGHEAFIQIKTGPNTLIPHHYGTERRFADGEVVHADCSGYFGAYLSDLARTGIAGCASQMQQDLYAKLFDALRSAIERATPGTPAGAVYDHCKAQLQRAGLDFRMPHVGHSLGLGYHEHPVFRPEDRTPLEAGMVMDVEPGVVGPDNQQYHVEDTILITEQGAEILSDYDGTPLYELG